MERAKEEGAPPMPLTIVFVERKNRCDEVAEALNAQGVAAVPLHGGLSQVSSSTGLQPGAQTYPCVVKTALACTLHNGLLNLYACGQSDDTWSGALGHGV